MCEYCKDGKIIMQKDVIHPFCWGWGGDLALTQAQAIEQADPMGIFIDRGFLRFTDLDDAQCLDHGEKVKINFCPFCGQKIESLDRV